MLFKCDEIKKTLDNRTTKNRKKNLKSNQRFVIGDVAFSVCKPKKLFFPPQSFKAFDVFTTSHRKYLQFFLLFSHPMTRSYHPSTQIFVSVFRFIHRGENSTADLDERSVDPQRPSKSRVSWSRQLLLFATLRRKKKQQEKWVNINIGCVCDNFCRDISFDYRFLFAALVSESKYCRVCKFSRREIFLNAYENIIRCLPLLVWLTF